MMRNSKRWFSILAMNLFFAIVSYAQYSGVDGCTPGPCANATPCRHCTGNWSDKYGDTWNITSSLVTNSVTGTLSVSNPGCPTIVFQVSGSIAPTGGSYPFTPGTTSATLHGTNPNPSSECGGYIPVNVTVTEQIRNDGCDIAAGTSQNDDGSFTDTAFSMAKIPDLPTGESTQAVGWNATYQTVQQFRQTLQGDAQRPFDGRQVTEVPGSDKQDNCFYQGAADNGYSQFGVTGGWWIVGRYATPPNYFLTNEWVDDYVGMTSDLVTFYRQNGRAPCDSYAQQLMNMCTNGQGCSLKRQYYADYITFSLDATTVTAGRNAVLQSRNWP
jgi:hypothetical protein